MQPEADDVSFHLTCSQLLFIFLVFSLRLFTFHYFFTPFFFFFLFIFSYFSVCPYLCDTLSCFTRRDRHVALEYRASCPARVFFKIYKAPMNGHYFNPHYQLMSNDRGCVKLGFRIIMKVLPLSLSLSHSVHFFLSFFLARHLSFLLAVFLSLFFVFLSLLFSFSLSPCSINRPFYKASRQ